MKIWLTYLSGRQKSSQIASNVERIGAHVVFWLCSCYFAISITRSISKCHMVMSRESKAHGRSPWNCDGTTESDALPQAEQFQSMSLRHSHNKNNSTQWECFEPTPDVYTYTRYVAASPPPSVKNSPKPQDPWNPASSQPVHITSSQPRASPSRLRSASAELACSDYVQPAESQPVQPAKS